MKCENCGTLENVEWMLDSYMFEIYGEEIYRWYCESCENENYMNV